MMTKTLLPLLLLTTGSPVSAAAPLAKEAHDPLHAACAAVPGEEPTLPGIAITKEPKSEDGSQALRVTDEATGGYLLVFYEDDTEAAARAQASCLGAQIALVAREVGDERIGAQWWNVAFTSDPDYRAPPIPGEVSRWAVLIKPDGTLGPAGSTTVTYVMPHEQVHAFQRRNRRSLPRWLAEGHAVWIHRNLKNRFDPAIENQQWRLRAERAAQSEGPLRLTEWDQQKIKREAFLRQVSAEERAKMEADPDYQPVGVFTFTDDDFEEEFVANDQARYLASLAILEGLENRHGTAAVRAWIAELTDGEPGRISEETVDASLRTHFGETLEEALGNAR